MTALHFTGDPGDGPEEARAAILEAIREEVEKVPTMIRGNVSTYGRQAEAERLLRAYRADVLRVLEGK